VRLEAGELETLDGEFMITEDMVAFWLRHRKYPDILDRGSPTERSVLTGEEWTLLEELVASLKLNAQNLTSEEFQERTEQQLASNVARPAIEKLRAIAREDSAARMAAI
jgi:hypothetical protein